MGNLFYRGQSISEIYKLDYKQLEYWSSWHDIIENEKAKVKCGNCGSVYDSTKQNKCSCGKG